MRSRRPPRRTGVEEASRSAAPRSPVTRLLPWGIAAALALALVWFATRPAVENRTLPHRKLEVTEIENLNPFIFNIYGAQISPDGSTVAYVSKDQLWLRRLDELESRVATDSTFESAVVWSPDGQWLVYPAGRTLWKISATGGESRPVADLPTNVGPFGGGWTEDGKIVFTTGYSGLLQVSEQGGDLTTILEPDPETEVDFHHARVLPEGKGVLFGIHFKDRPEGPLALWDGTERRILYEIEGSSMETPVYSPTGHILYVRRPESSGIWALPFSLENLAVTGEPFLVARDVVSPSVSNDGTLTYLSGVFHAPRELQWIDRQGNKLGVAGLPQIGISEPALSPDLKQVALTAWEGSSRELWVQDLERGPSDRSPSPPRRREVPTGLRTVGAWCTTRFSTSRRCAWWIWRTPTRVSHWAAGDAPPSPSMERSSSSSASVLAASGTSSWTRTELQASRSSSSIPPGDESEPTVSPDGKWLAYSGDETGRVEIYLTRFPERRGQMAGIDERRCRRALEPRWHRAVLCRLRRLPDGRRNLFGSAADPRRAGQALRWSRLRARERAALRGGSPGRAPVGGSQSRRIPQESQAHAGAELVRGIRERSLRDDGERPARRPATTVESTDR